jgi:SAM-dependent methyltransferase
VLPLLCNDETVAARELSAGPELGWLESRLRCPECGGTMELHGHEFQCSHGHVFEIADGIPVLVAEPTEASSQSSSAKHRQVEYFDSESEPEYEIVRPHGTVAFHGGLLEEKFRLGTKHLGGVGGLSALVVCGGSGMDAEFLERAGARPVVCSDLSPGAASRARERAERFGLRMTPVIADAENLPFADQSFDLVFVHDGLHHIEDPSIGLREMARVAARAVSVNEPARAAATNLAVKVGLSVEYEEAGNRVARVSGDEIGDVLDAAGFEVIRAERYAMLYRHEPGPTLRFLSRRRVRGLAQTAWRAGNALTGRFGNKLTVQAIRRRSG